MNIFPLLLFWLAAPGAAMASANQRVANLLSNSSLVDNGKSLRGGRSPEAVLRSRKGDYSPRCLINVENWTLWKLKDPQSHSQVGYIDTVYNAVSVEPGTREVMMAYKAVWVKGSCID